MLSATGKCHTCGNESWIVALLVAGDNDHE